MNLRMKLPHWFSGWFVGGVSSKPANSLNYICTYKSTYFYLKPTITWLVILSWGQLTKIFKRFTKYPLFLRGNPFLPFQISIYSRNSVLTMLSHIESAKTHWTNVSSSSMVSTGEGLNVDLCSGCSFLKFYSWLWYSILFNYFAIGTSVHFMIFQGFSTKALSYFLRFDGIMLIWR